MSGAEIFHHLKAILKKRGLATAVGDEGGFAPRLESNEAALAVILEAVEKAGYTPGRDISFALDCAASEFYDGDKKLYTFDKKEVDGAALIDIYAKLAEKYPLISIEDGCAEGDWETWKLLTDKLGNRRSSSSATISSSPTSRVSRAASRPASRTRSS